MLPNPTVSSQSSSLSCHQCFTQFPTLNWNVFLSYSSESPLQDTQLFPFLCFGFCWSLLSFQTSIYFSTLSIYTHYLGDLFHLLALNTISVLRNPKLYSPVNDNLIPVALVRNFEGTLDSSLSPHCLDAVLQQFCSLPSKYT